MSDFTFSFSGDDIVDNSMKDDPPQSHTTESSSSRRHSHSAFPIAGQKILEPEVHLLNAMLKTLPSRLAYSTLQLPLINGSEVSIPRRELWDVRLQLMAAQDDENLANLGGRDVKTGVYEGGFKSWESSADIVKILGAGIATILEGPNNFLELGCGTALPSLFIFQDFLHRDSGAPGKINLGLADYNPAVLHLVTLPNLILSWALVHSDSWEAEGEIEIDEELLQEFLRSLDSHNITLSFFSGGWGPEFVQLVLASMNSEVNQSTIIGSETIYSSFSLNAFAETLIDLLRLMAGTHKTSLVAAKNVYFGVGGSMEDFYRKVRANGCLVQQILEESEGVRRTVVEVKMIKPS